MIEILPAILDKTPEEYKAHVEQLHKSHSFQEGWVHIDFADDIYVPNKTIDTIPVKDYPLNLKKEAHMMVEYPIEWLVALKEAGFDRVIFHFGSKNNPEEVIDEAKKLGMEVGIALNPDVPVTVIELYKDKIDMVLIMGVVPGFQGQPFVPETFQKIKDLKSRDWAPKISVDGAVSDLNARELIDAGVDQLVVGSFLIKGDIDSNLEKLWEAVNT